MFLKKISIKIKHIASLLLLLSLNTAYTQDKTVTLYWDADETIVRGEGGVINESGSLQQHGKWTYYYNSYSKTKAIEGEFKNGLPYGDWKAFYPNGEIYLTGKYIIENNLDKNKSYSHGFWASYWSDGTVANTYNFNKGHISENDVKFISTRKAEKYTYSNGNYGTGERVLAATVNKSDDYIIGIDIYDSVLEDDGTSSAGGFYRNGPWIEYYASGDVKAVGEYSWKTNYGIGAWTFYYTNGQVKSKVNYNENGKRHGLATYYHSNGQLNYEENLNNDELIGSTKLYNENGVLVEERTGDGKGNILSKRYWENGNLKYEGGLAWSKKDKEYLFNGIVTLYHENGVKHKKLLYENDKILKYLDFVTSSGMQSATDGEGFFRTIYSDGTVDVFEISNGLKHGELTYYYSNGQKKYVEIWKEGEYVKILEFYEPDGTQTLADGYGTRKVTFNDGEYEVSNYIDGFKNGEATTYYKNGNKKLVRIFKDNEEHKFLDQWTHDGEQTLTNGNGIYYAYHSNGKIHVKSEYKNGGRDGYTTWYYNNGQKEVTTLYKYDPNSFSGFRWEVIDSYHRNGKERLAGNLYRGNGAWYQYDSNGNLTHANIYENGKKVKVVSADNL